MKKTIILFSGGLDSTTLLYYAKDKGLDPACLIFDYGQRHRKEIQTAKKIATYSKSKYYIIKFMFPWKGSSLIDKKMRIPTQKKAKEETIPSTYVPGRNIIFLSFAASFAETIGAREIYLGANAIDYSGYPDCRPSFIAAYQEVLKKGLKSGVGGKPIKVSTPLLHKTKAQIIRLGLKLNVPYDLTWSCYRGGKNPCGQCDSCFFRAKGFEATKTKDPLLR